MKWLSNRNVFRIESLIGKDAQVHGDITGEGNIKIDGALNGNIQIKGDVVVAAGATIVGSICAENVVLMGTVNGDIHANGFLLIQKEAVTTGFHRARRLGVEEGASLSGNCEIDHDGTHAAAQLRQTQLDEDDSVVPA